MFIDDLPMLYNIYHDYFYHYTSFEAAVKIVTSRELLFSEIKKVNDINESSGPLTIADNPNDFKDLQEYLDSFTQISLTMDVGKHKGFDIPAMWGHYAQRGRGACLVLDRQKLIEEISSRDLYSKEVVYDVASPYDIYYDKNRYGSPGVFITTQRDELFFRKSPDWEYEQEYRIIAIDDNPCPLSIEKSLCGVILFSRTPGRFLESVEYRTFSALAKDLFICRYSSGGVRETLYDENNQSLIPPLKFEIKEALHAK